MRKEVNMLEGSIAKGLLSMMIPIMIMNVMQTMFSVIDMTVLGNLVDDNAVGAVGACSVIITLCTALLIGVSVGANVIVAKHIGAGDRKKTEEAIGTSLAFSLLGGIVIAVIGIVFAKTFLLWTNCDSELLYQATSYFKIYFMGVPIIMFYNFSASVLRAAGETKLPMYFLIVGGIFKIIFNFFSITVLGLDVEGVALATVASNLIAGGLCYLRLTKMKDRFTVSVRLFRIKPEELKPMIYIGVPAGLQSALYSLANVVIASTVNTFGKEATTGLAIANQFDGIMYQIIYAPSLALVPYMAQNIGAGNIKRAKRALATATLLNIAIGASLGALSAIFSKELSGIMSDDPTVIMYSMQKMVIVSSTYFICGINEILGGALRGMGKPILPVISTLLFMCGIRFIWVYGVFPYFPENITFLYLIWPIGWILSISTLIGPTIWNIKKLERIG